MFEKLFDLNDSICCSSENKPDRDAVPVPVGVIRDTSYPADQHDIEPKNSEKDKTIQSGGTDSTDPSSSLSLKEEEEEEEMPEEEDLDATRSDEDETEAEDTEAEDNKDDDDEQSRNEIQDDEDDIEAEDDGKQHDEEEEESVNLGTAAIGAAVAGAIAAVNAPDGESDIDDVDQESDNEKESGEAKDKSVDEEKYAADDLITTPWDDKMREEKHFTEYRFSTKPSPDLTSTVTAIGRTLDSNDAVTERNFDAKECTWTVAIDKDSDEEEQETSTIIVKVCGVKSQDDVSTPKASGGKDKKTKKKKKSFFKRFVSSKDKKKENAKDETVADTNYAILMYMTNDEDVSAFEDICSSIRSSLIGLEIPLILAKKDERKFSEHYEISDDGTSGKCKKTEKEVTIGMVERMEEEEAQLSEILLLKVTEYSNVVALLDFFEENDKYYVVMETVPDEER